MIEIHKVKYFSVVAQTAHIGKAAKLLHITPAALSKSIKSLEEDLGVELIINQGRGIAVTDEGRQFFHQSKTFLEDYENLTTNFSKKLSQDRILRFGTFEVFSTYFMSWFLKNHAQEKTCHIRELAPGRIEEALLNNTIDIGITHIPHSHEELEYLNAGKFAMHIYGNDANFNTMLARDLPFSVPITVVSGTPIGSLSLDGWPASAGQRKIKYEFEMLETALQTASQKLSVIYAPNFVVEQYNNLVTKKYRLQEISPMGKSVSTKFSVYIVKRKNQKIARPIRLLIDAFKAVLR